MAGVTSGLAAAVLVFLLLWRLYWYRWLLPIALGLGAVVGVPGGIGLGFLLGELRGPYQVAGKWYNYQGQELNPWGWRQEWSSRNANAWLAGIAGGVGLGLLVAGGVGWWYHAQARSARRRLDEAVEQAEKDFPAVVQTWGGAEAMHDPAAVENLLRAVEKG
jgi:hypothetical protein